MWTTRLHRPARIIRCKRILWNIHQWNPAGNRCDDLMRVVTFWEKNPLLGGSRMKHNQNNFWQIFVPGYRITLDPLPRYAPTSFSDHGYPIVLYPIYACEVARGQYHYQIKRSRQHYGSDKRAAEQPGPGELQFSLDFLRDQSNYAQVKNGFYGERDSKNARQRRLGLPKQLPSFVYSDLFRLGPLVDHSRFRPHWFTLKHALNFQSPGPTYYSLRPCGRDSNNKYAVSGEFIHNFPAPGHQQSPALAIC